MKVVHCKREPYTVYIGRPGKFGNPFVVGAGAWHNDRWSREAAIAKFEQYARATAEVMAAIKALPPDAVLGCWCKPKNACHGDVIVKLWHELHNKG